MKVTRRQFVKGGVAAFTVTFAAPDFLSDLAQAQGTHTRNLVVLNLSGGNDALSMLVPYNDPFYYSRRPTLAILAGTVLRPEMFIGRLLETRVFRWVGRLSYSLYLWQTPFMAPTVPSPLGSLQLFPLNVIGLIATAAASYYVIERPMIALGRRLSSDRAMVAVPMPLAASSEATLF